MRTALLALSATLASVAAAPASAAIVQYAGNGHYYEFVSTQLSFADALADAATRSHLGNQGYLVTVTSAGENDFIYNSVTSNTVHAAGSDAANEGDWIWVAGPESGQAFSYTNWAPGEPNNCCGGENYLLLNWGGSQWNDIYPGAGNYSYVVEYGGLQSGVPEPATWGMLLLGFGAVGAALRRRKPVAAATPRIRFA